jgi:glycosyltransferase involved in cell wall biosynthesis
MAPDRGTALAFLGPALGGHDGWVTTQGEVLAGLFAAEGDRVLVSSDRIPPLRRAADHARDLVRWRREAAVAIVSVFSGRAFALGAESLALARALGVPSVAWLHGGGLPAYGERHPRLVRRTLGLADEVVAPSAFLARWADGMGLASRVIPNVVDLGAYEHRPRTTLRPRLLWMRTFLDAYDPMTAVRVLARLRADGLDATLTMAGQDKGLLGPTRALASDLGLGHAVTFPGFASGSGKLRLLADHDVFLNTNLVDNAPVTVLEAAASGLVVVSTAVGGVPDLLPDGEAARLVPAGDVEAMAGAVVHLLGHPQEAASLAAAARAVAERSDRPAVQGAWRDLVADLGDR